MDGSISRPIKPSEVLKLKKETIPNEVFDAFNELIAEKFDGYESTFKKSDVVNLIVQKLSLENNQKIIYDKHWLDIESLYQKAGWKVYYDKPGYNENYQATFTFSLKKK